jgi:acyl-CoA dehydrogenase
VRVGTKVESLYRDIRSLRIYEGATEVQQLIIGKSVLKTLPASPVPPSPLASVR